MKHNGEDLPQTVPPCRYDVHFDGHMHLACAAHNALFEGDFLMRWTGEDAAFEPKSQERLDWERGMRE